MLATRGPRQDAWPKSASQPTELRSRQYLPNKRSTGRLILHRHLNKAARLVATLFLLTLYWLTGSGGRPLVAAPSTDSALIIVTWNLESGGADPTTLTGQIAAFDGVDLWGLSEVNGDDDALLFEASAEVGEAADFARVTGMTGGGDRLVALYDDERFDLVASSELEAINIGGNVRATCRLRCSTSGRRPRPCLRLPWATST